jgi:glucose-1-phosphate thymidylyltransferase
VKAILLCAGFATRMYPLTRRIPKPLLSVRGRPILEDLVEQIAATGRVRHIAVVSNGRFYGRFLAWAEELAGRLPGLVIDVLDDGARDEAHRLGAVSDLEFAVARERPEGPVLVAAGDNLFRFPLEEFLADYEANPRNLVVAYRERDPRRLRRTAVAELGPEDRVLRLWEQPDDPPSEWACPPLYVFRPGALDRLREFIVAEHDTESPGHFVAWLADQEPVFAHRMRGARLDVGNLEGYRGAEAWLEALERDGSAGT